MASLHKALLLVLLLLDCSTIFQPACGAKDTITTREMIRDGDTMISSHGVFELGFFSPGNSTNRYLGMWYRNITARRIVWVANREAPLADSSGVLKVVGPGFLRLLDAANRTVWSSKASSRPVQNPVAQLLDSGNLVVKDPDDGETENFLWKSFDYPTDTVLPGMRLGRNYVSGIETYATSWRSDDDPAPGDFSLHLDPTGYPQVVLKKGTEIQFRVGTWNGTGLSGAPFRTQNAKFRFQFVMNEEEVYFSQDVIDGSVVTIAMVNQSGHQQLWTWVDRQQSWISYVNLPADGCDQYKLCGVYGACTSGSPFCTCLDKFVPKDQQGWNRADRSSGCIRRNNLSCEGDVFLKYPGIKLPDSRSSRYVNIPTLEGCEAECLKNCSCIAYAQLGGNENTGCLFWFEDLVDMKGIPQNGDVIYIRMSSVEAEKVADSNGKKKEIITIAVSLTGMVIFLIGISLFLYVRKGSRATRIGTKGKQIGSDELPLFDLSTILKATNHFSIDNKLGKGGFGPVYKGVLEDGQEIAVKRLSKDSHQGLNEFKNEINFIVKLQHRNLVRLLGGCIQEEENMLIYEYMPNKSLDIILFDQTRSVSLDWKKRFNIISGISRGLLYLHQDSRLRIIHRDLKASNVLLDSDMNPKISDFGLARSFGRNETEAITRRVVGTYGYMSPEYAIDGLFSLKSDVFSFGVLLLETVSGMKNRLFSCTDHSLNLLGHAWKLYKEGRSLEIIDPCLTESIYISEMQRAIHVGLLCVQQNPEDRPSMSTVVFMLSNEGAFPQAKQPGFFTERQVIVDQGSNDANAANSTNRITITTLEAR